MKVAVQLKRCETYSQISVHRTEALLLPRWLRRDSTSHTFLENPTVFVSEKITSSCCKSNFPKQVALTTQEPSTLPVKGFAYYKFNSVNLFSCTYMYNTLSMHKLRNTNYF